jgi:hypothetical protein
MKLVLRFYGKVGGEYRDISWKRIDRSVNRCITAACDARMW